MKRLRHLAPFSKNAPLRRKLMAIVMLTCGMALLLASAAFIVHDQTTHRRAMTREIAVLTDLFDDNVAPGIAFNDSNSINDTLKSLDANPDILTAMVFDQDLRVLGRYDRGTLTEPLAIPTLQVTGVYPQADRLDAFRTIVLAGEPIGTLYVASDLKELQARMWKHTLIVVLVLISCYLAAYLLSWRLQGIITEPIAHLLEVTNEVAENKNYGVRAAKRGEDELGRLIDGFNEMLHQIEHRDIALHSAQSDLERRVADRTEELAESVSLLNATLESTADGILAFSLTGTVACMNAKFVSMAGIPEAMVARRNADEMLGWVGSLMKHPRQFLDRVADLRTHPESEAADALDLKDGRTFERLIHPQRIEGQAVGMVINLRDITPRKQAEARLEEAHKQVVEASRQAGMAEVATGVLHNVGNVLNSVNVSASLVSDTLRKSKSVSLNKVAVLIEEHAADLGTFLANHPQGRQLPAYIKQLAEHVGREREMLGAEMELLRKNIEHIKEIVAMQQSYAKVSGFMERVQLADLVEDALRMNAGALARHEVQVVREFTNIPPILVDKHKTLQILVNLIRNAKYACDESNLRDKRLTLRIAREGDSIHIIVNDNGVGIPKESLTRIFNHGFTTRKDGHGFGLHSGGLAAKEMGGSLSAYSDGLGFGATFILQLPLLSDTDYQLKAV